jgi:hypothetical protein
LICHDETGVTIRYKDYRRAGADRQQVMTLNADEFIRRFLLRLLSKGFRRIRHYGLLAGANRKVRLVTSANCSGWHRHSPTMLPWRHHIHARRAHAAVGE